jgi:polysaccharide biosynthesis protein PslH
MPAIRWLYVTSMPWPLTNGSALRVWHMAQALIRQGDTVTLLTDSSLPSVEDEYRSRSVSVLRTAGPTMVSGSAGRWSLSPFRHSECLAGEIGRRAAAYDAVVLVGPGLLQYASQTVHCGRVVVDMIDDPILEASRRLWQGSNPMGWLRRGRLLVELRFNERNVPGPISLFTFVSPQDASHFNRRHRHTRVMTSPNGVDLEFFRPGNERDAQEDTAPTVAFVGNFGHLPNTTAALFLARKIAPLVWKRCPEAKVVLVGSDPSDELRAMACDRLEVTGHVADVRPYVAHASVVLLPMRTGTGIKNKLLEAWAMGRPVVATSLACQGIPARHGDNILIGESSQTLADLTCQLIRDKPLRQRIGAGGRHCAEGTFSWDLIATSFRSAVCNIPAQEPRHVD